MLEVVECKGQLPQDCARADRFHGHQMSEAVEVKVEPPEESAEADTVDESQMFETMEIKMEPPDDTTVSEPQMFEAVEVKVEPPEDPPVCEPQVFEFVAVKTEPCEGSAEGAGVDVSQLQAPAPAIKGANSTKTGDGSAPHPSRAASAQGPKATIHCQAKKIILNVVEGGKVEKKVTWLLFPLSKPLAEYVADAPGRLNQRSSESCYITSQENVKQNVVPGKLEIGAGESKSFTTFGIHTQQTEKGEEERLCGIRQKCGLREEEFNKFSCSFCLQSFPSKYRLIMHVFIHIDGVEPPTYVCKSCGEVFPSNISLVRHVKMSGHIYNHENTTEETGKQSSNEETRMISRKFCNDNYNTRITTICAGERDRRDNFGSSSITGNINHRAVVPAYKCDLCGRGFSQLKNYSRHRLIHAVIPAHKCDLCGRGFAQLKHYNRHRLTHAAIRPHACNICGKSFAQKCHLRQHSLIHTGTPQHKCDICGKSFILLGNLNRHSLIHTDTKEHKCDLCGKYFREKSHLKAHLVVHSGLKPYRCGTCRKSFTQLVHLKAHSALHNKDKQDKKYT